MGQKRLFLAVFAARTSGSVDWIGREFVDSPQIKKADGAVCRT
jgi:hypothetical protein